MHRSGDALTPPASVSRVAFLRKAIWGACIGGALFTAGVLIHTLDRGLDLWDEGFTLAYADSPGGFFFRFSFFDYIIDRTFFWMEHTVLNYRRVSVLLAASSSLAFASGFWRWLRAHMGFPGDWLSGAFVASLCLLGNLLYFAHFPRAVQYNNLNAFLVVTASGLVLTLLSFGRKRPRWKEVVVAGGAGVLTAGILFVKFSSLLPFGMLVVLAIIGLQDSVSFKRRLQTLGYLAGGFGLGVALFFTAVLPPVLWWNSFAYSIGLELQNAHEGSKIIQIYWDDVRRYANNFVPNVPVALLWFALAVLGGARWKPPRGGRLFLWAVALGGAAYLFWRLQGTVGVTLRLPEPFLFLPLVLLPVIAAVLGTQKSRAVSRHVLGVGIFLAAMPFAGSFGTANGIVFGTLPYLVGMAALTLLIGLLLDEVSGREVLSSGVLLIFLGLAVHTTLTRLVYLPRGIAPIAQQTERAEGLPRLEGLYLSRPLNEYLSTLKALLERDTLFQPGDPMMFVYDNPAVVYALGGRSPGMPWYFFHRDPLNCAVLAGAVARREFEPRRMLILTQEGPRPRLRECLSVHGIAFPEDFTELASVEYAGVAEAKKPTRSMGNRRRRLRLEHASTRVFVPRSMLRDPGTPSRQHPARYPDGRRNPSLRIPGN